MDLIVFIPALWTYGEALYGELYNQFTLIEDSQVLFYLFDTIQITENGQIYRRSPGVFKGVAQPSIAIFTIGALAILAQIILVSIGYNLEANFIGTIAPFVTSMLNFAMSVYHKATFIGLENAFKGDDIQNPYRIDYDGYMGINGYQHLRRSFCEFFTNVGICRQDQIVEYSTNLNMPLRFYQNNIRNVENGRAIKERPVA